MVNSIIFSVRQYTNRYKKKHLSSLQPRHMFASSDRMIARWLRVRIRPVDVRFIILFVGIQRVICSRHVRIGGCEVTLDIVHGTYITLVRSRKFTTIRFVSSLQIIQSSRHQIIASIRCRSLLRIHRRGTHRLRGRRRRDNRSRRNILLRMAHPLRHHTSTGYRWRTLHRRRHIMRRIIRFPALDLASYRMQFHVPR